jgi:hypothetical protein
VRFSYRIQSLEQQEATRKELDALASQFHDKCEELRQAEMALEEHCDTSSTLQEHMPTAAQHALKMELEAAIDQSTNAVITGKTKVAAARQQLSEFVLACKALPQERMHAAVANVVAEFDRCLLAWEPPISLDGVAISPVDGSKKCKQSSSSSSSQYFAHANGGIQGMKEEHHTVTSHRLPCAKIDISYIFSGVIQPRSEKAPAGVQKTKQSKWEIKSGGKRKKISCSYCYASKRRCEGALDNGCFACVKKGIKCEPHTWSADGIFVAGEADAIPDPREAPTSDKSVKKTKQFRSLGVQTVCSWLEKRMPFLIQDEANGDGRLSPTCPLRSCPSQQLVQVAESNDNSASDSESSGTKEQIVLDAEFFNQVFMGGEFQKQDQWCIRY